MMLAITVSSTPLQHPTARLNPWSSRDCVIAVTSGLAVWWRWLPPAMATVPPGALMMVLMSGMFPAPRAAGPCRPAALGGGSILVELEDWCDWGYLVFVWHVQVRFV